MANTFHDLSTDSSGEARDWQSNRAKDGFPKVGPASHPSPDSSRWDLADVAGADTKGVDIPNEPIKPQL